MADIHYNTDQIYQILRQEIMLLTLEPGTLVSEADISQRFSVSRTPVREVFKRLELENLLEVRPQRGTFVSRIRLDSLYDLMFIREAVELTALTELLSRIEPRGIFKLRLQIMEQERLFEAKLSRDEFVRSFLQADNIFHQTLYTLVDRRGVWDFISTTRPHYNRFRILNDTLNQHVCEDILARHRDIVDALETHDLPRMQELHRRPLYNSTENITRVVRAYPDFFYLSPSGT